MGIDDPDSFKLYIEDIYNELKNKYNDNQNLIEGIDRGIFIKFL
jgi:hypothetical protein